MHMMVRTLLIYRLTRSPAILGIMALAHSLPMMCLSLFAGVYVDRYHKKHLILVCQTLFIILSLCIAMTISLGYLGPDYPRSWLILLVAAMLQGVIMSIMMPSRMAMIPEIVGKEAVMNAVALAAFGTNILRILSPALAGFLIDAIGFEAIYYTMACLYLAATFFMFLVPKTDQRSSMQKAVWADLKGGLRYVWQERNVLFILLFLLFVVILSAPFQSLLPIFTEDILNIKGTGLGMLMSISALGAVTASLILAPLHNRKRGAILTVSCLVMGIGLLGFSFSKSLILSFILVFIIGMGQAGRMTLGMTLTQYYADKEYHGRVMSLYNMEVGLKSFGTFFAGLMAERIGAPWSIGGLALALICLCVLVLAFVPRIRDLD